MSRQCKYCGGDKEWIWTGQRLKDGSKIYVDDNGKRWAGRRCPDCERSRVSEAVRCDSFDRAIVVKELEVAGYEIVNKTLPIVVRKAGQEFKVAVRRAVARGKDIVAAGTEPVAEDLVVVIFNSARVLTPDLWDKIAKPDGQPRPQETSSAAQLPS
jgi:hypothetical protein